MKELVYILTIFIFFQSCQQKTENEASLSSRETVQKKDKTEDEVKKIKIENREDITINRDSINNFLDKPFDLYEFKKIKNGSLSGGTHFQDYHYRPEFSGVGYRFFMFEPKTTNYIVDGKEMRHSKVGYLGDQKKNISFKEDGLVIKTIQPNDKYKNKYLNPNEFLIEVLAKFNDFDLPELALVGLDSISIIKKLGKPDLYRMNSMVYQNDNKALILNIRNKKVKWLKYIIMKEGIDIAKGEEIFEI